MKTQNIRAFLAMVMIQAMQGNQIPEKKQVKVFRKDAPIPSGCKEYYFSIKGNPSTKLEDKTGAIYSCISVNEKNAIRKYKKWINTPQFVQS